MLSALIGLALATGAVELALRLVPSLLPDAYLDTLPLRGLALLDPKLAKEMPLEGVPLPYAQPPGFSPGREYHSGPPEDLRLYGLVPAGRSPDADAYPQVRLPLDSRGLPNAKAVRHAEILLVGDSFAFTGAVTAPPGLQSVLAANSGATVYNLGVPGTESLQQHWLLEHYGGALGFDAVIWLYFAGNDLDETQRLLARKRSGMETYADLLAESPLSPFLLGEVISSVWRPATAKVAPGLAGARLAGFPAGEPVWFLPHYLKQLAMAGDEWQRHPAWPVVRQTLSTVHRTLRDQGKRMLLVYVPTKAEAYLPFLDPKDARLRAMAAMGQGSVDVWVEKAWKNRGAQEDILRSFGREAGIDFLSLVPLFTRMARQGQAAYFAGDTHWSPLGQRAAALELVRWYLDADHD
ncbi:MAG: hypothetical protein KDH88_07285 [Chromatiales bacterium]|nr:hypothetical protein [Chromatiales bacterium]